MRDRRNWVSCGPSGALRANTDVLVLNAVSVDSASPVNPQADPVFLHVQAGMTVVVADDNGAWCMADVLHVEGGARNPRIPTLFQVADVDSGVVTWVNADLVTHIVPVV